MSGEVTEPAEEASATPLADTGPHGLYSFNLGSVPASVTPPRSWRRAAGFMVFASAAALVGLLVMTVSLVAPTDVAEHIASLPNLPTGPQINEPTTTQAAPAQPGHTGGTDRGGATPDDAAGAPEIDRVAVVSQLPGPVIVTAPGAAPSAAGTGTGDPTTTTEPDPTPLTTVTGIGPVSTDPRTLAARTQTFFKEVAANVSAAAAMTCGAVRDDAVALIRQRYGEVSTIQVQSIELDPRTAVTVSLLKVTDLNGDSSTQQATLRFTFGSDPMIENPGG